MRPSIIALFLFAAFPAFSQKGGQRREYDQLQINYNALNDSLSAMRKEIDLLLADLEKNRQFSDSSIAVLREENEKLRQIMRSYILQIDELNTTNLQLESELEDCKKAN